MGFERVVDLLGRTFPDGVWTAISYHAICLAIYANFGEGAIPVNFLSTSVRLLATAWCAALVGLIAIGTFSSARIGTMTWGPTHDIWSAAIAISQINLGLHGKLGYKEVELAIAGEVTGTKDALQVMDDETRALLKDPDAVTRGFQAGAAVQQTDVVIPKNTTGYTMNWAEDLGYVDFYNVAFRLFGFNAFATHWLYVSLLAVATILFVSLFFYENLAMGSLVFVITALFLESSSAIFDQYMPSFAANRFLSTLAVVPLLHVICTALRQRPSSLFEFVLLVVQLLLLTFAVAARSSGQWCYIAVIICIAAAIALRVRVAESKSQTIRSAMRIRYIPFFMRLASVGALLVVVGGTVGVFRNSQFDDSYFWDDNQPNHMFWHSAFIALSLHPDWSKLKPYPDVADMGDEVGFNLYQHVMKEQGRPYLSDRGLYLVRPYEIFIRKEYTKLLVGHPRYASELFFIYKPQLIVSTILLLVESIPTNALWLAAVSLALAISLFLLPGGSLKITELATAIVLIWSCSLLPVFWAYASPHVIVDQLWSTLFVLLAILAFSAASIVHNFSPYFRKLIMFFGRSAPFRMT
jgi:hypothetical protein